MIFVNEEKIETKFFPDGTPCILNLPDIDSNIEIYWRYNSKEFTHIVFILAHYHSKKNNITLSVPYLPNARMDRVKSENECYTLKHFIEIIGVYVDVLKIMDVHSDKAIEFAVNDGIVVDEYQPVSFYVSSALKRFNCDFICYPDKGAYDRYSNILSTVKAYQFYCDKKRDWKTGKIKSVDIAELPDQDFRNHSVLIVDDICSYGGTIDRCAAKLREAGFGSVYAYVTHCENSIFDGKLLYDGSNIEGIYTTNSIERDEKKRSFIDKIFYEAKL